MRLLRVLLVRAAEADVGLDGDERGPVVRLGGLDGGVDRGDVVAVVHALGVPAVGVEARDDVLGERPGGGAVELDPVVVVEGDQLAELEVAGQRRGLGRDALLEVAVGADDVGAVVDDLVAGPVELAREAALRDGHAHAVDEALAERAGGGLDARRDAVLRVARGDRAPLAEALEVVEGDRVAGQVEHRVQQHARVAGGQDEAVPVRPGGVRGRVAEVLRPQGEGHRGHAHGRARVPGVGLLHAVDGQGADGVDGKPLELVRGQGHRCLRVRGTHWRDCGRRWGGGQRGAFGREGPSYRADPLRWPGVTGGPPRRARSPAYAPAMPSLPPSRRVSAPRRGVGRPGRPRRRRARRPGGRCRPRPGPGPGARHRRHGPGDPAPGRVRRQHGTLAGPARSPEHAGVRDRAGRRRSRAGRRGHRRRGHGARGARRGGAGPGGSACSWSRAASARSSRTAAPPSGYARRTCGPPGSPAPTPCTCPPTRCSTSRSARPGWPPRSSPTSSGVLVSVDLSSSAPAAREGPPDRPVADPERGPGPPVRHQGRVEGPRGREARGAAAGPVAGRRHQAGPQGRRRPGP